MTTILITNAVTSGIAILSFLTVAARRRRADRQRVYVLLDGQQVTRDQRR